jgi:tRNA modification GTPase
MGYVIVHTYHHDNEPIVACCTARGAGSIALIRIAGENALIVADRIAQLPSSTLLSSVPTHTIHYGHTVDATGTKIDTVMFLVMHGPRTFTGQDTVEITAHNNPFIIDAIIDAACNAGARLAQPGEFSKRAVLAGKMDLLQAEALHEFVQAGTMQGLKSSYAQLSGSLSHEIATIEKKLLHALALANASFEFIEEENLEFGTTIKTLITDIITHTEKLIECFPLQQQLKEGARIALVGSVNAGKSSLFNALLGAKRAIVTPIPGTTRDVIEAGIYRQGSHQTLIDTAGMRTTHDVIEQEGIARSEQEAARADIVLIVIDATRMLTPEEEKVYDQLAERYQTKAILVYTKSDLVRVNTYQPFCTVNKITVSVHKPETITQLMQAIDAHHATQLAHGGSTLYLLNERQIRLLQTLNEKLHTLEATLHAPLAYEIIAHHIHDALATISELTGKSVSEAAMDAIFKEFCVGK